jgi:hypothetical protein
METTRRGDEPGGERPSGREPWSGRRPRTEHPGSRPPPPPPTGGPDALYGEGYEQGYAGGPEPPPPPPPRRGRLDFSPFFALLDAVRRAVPGDLQNQFTALVRETLLTLRSLIDWYLERLDRPRGEPPVEDIPID